MASSVPATKILIVVTVDVAGSIPEVRPFDAFTVTGKDFAEFRALSGCIARHASRDGDLKNAHFFHRGIYLQKGPFYASILPVHPIWFLPSCQKLQSIPF